MRLLVAICALLAASSAWANPRFVTKGGLLTKKIAWVELGKDAQQTKLVTRKGSRIRTWKVDGFVGEVTDKGLRDRLTIGTKARIKTQAGGQAEIRQTKHGIVVNTITPGVRAVTRHELGADLDRAVQIANAHLETLR